jgi:hypothetical protein
MNKKTKVFIALSTLSALFGITLATPIVNLASPLLS